MGKIKTASEIEGKHTRIKPGTRVVVYSKIKPKKKILGCGTYIGRERGDIAFEATFGPIPPEGIKSPETGKVYHKEDYEKVTNPKIMMDNGEIVYGYKVWWVPLKKRKKTKGRNLNRPSFFWCL